MWGPICKVNRALPFDWSSEDVKEERRLKYFETEEALAGIAESEVFGR